MTNSEKCPHCGRDIHPLAVCPETWDEADKWTYSPDDKLTITWTPEKSAENERELKKLNEALKAKEPKSS
jgi:uncharacterized OB-fold protein